MIKAVLFDFWGTLVEIGVFPSPVKQVREILRLHRMPYRKFIVTFERSFMLEKSDDLYQAFTKVCEAFQREPSQEVLDELVGMWNKNKLLAKPFPESMKILEDLKKQYKIALLANSDCFSVRAVLEKYGLEKYFDEGLLSFEVGYLKIDREMYEDVLKRLGIAPGEAVMIGDSINSDIRSAENAGVGAILLDRRGTYPDFEWSIESLEDLPLALDELSAELQHRAEEAAEEPAGVARESDEPAEESGEYGESESGEELGPSAEPEGGKQPDEETDDDEELAE